MLRITNLLRGKIPKRIPMRGGLPNWDRPDPPPTPHYELDHQLSETQILFDFRDSGEPQFFLTQPEIYEGDTIIEVLPSFLTRWAFFLGIAGTMGFIVYYTNPLKKYNYVSEMKLSEIEKQKQAVSSKKWIKLAAQYNPIGLNPTPETYRTSTELSSMNKNASEQNQYNVNTRNQIQKYFLKVKEKAQKKVKERLAKGHSHQSTHQSTNSHAHAHDGHQSHQAPKVQQHKPVEQTSSDQKTH